MIHLSLKNVAYSSFSSGSFTDTGIEKLVCIYDTLIELPSQKVSYKEFQDLFINKTVFRCSDTQKNVRNFCSLLKNLDFVIDYNSSIFETKRFFKRNGVIFALVCKNIIETKKIDNGSLKGYLTQIKSQIIQQGLLSYFKNNENEDICFFWRLAIRLKTLHVDEYYYYLTQKSKKKFEDILLEIINNRENNEAYNSSEINDTASSYIISILVEANIISKGKNKFYTIVENNSATQFIADFYGERY